jgi:hypothetical protein
LQKNINNLLNNINEKGHRQLLKEKKKSVENDLVDNHH